MTNRKLWKCQDGTKIRIKDMADRHLQNAARMLLQFASKARSQTLGNMPYFQGEAAQELAEREWDRLNEMTDEEFAYQEISIYKDLVEEIMRRERSCLTK